jgi:hypothetical protein
MPEPRRRACLPPARPPNPHPHPHPQAAESRSASLRPQEVFNLAWSYAQLGWRPHALLRALGEQLGARADEFDPGELAGTAAAYARLHAADERLLQVRCVCVVCARTRARVCVCVCVSMAARQGTGCMQPRPSAAGSIRRRPPHPPTPGWSGGGGRACAAARRLLRPPPGTRAVGARRAGIAARCARCRGSCCGAGREAAGHGGAAAGDVHRGEGGPGRPPARRAGRQASLGRPPAAPMAGDEHLDGG